MDYMKAISTAVQAAGLAAEGIKYLIDHSEDITKSMAGLSTMLDAAKGLMDKAGDIVPIDELLTKAQAEGGQMDTGEDVPVPNEPQHRPPAFIKKAMTRATEFADGQKASFERRKLEQEMLRAVHESRRKVLEGATMRFSMKQLAGQLSSDKEGDSIVGLGVLDLPGCFAIARYGKIELSKDPTSFTGIYVGKHTCVGEGIARTIAPTGNADVYADIKYRQNVYVYVFTCPVDKLDVKYDALIQLFAAGESYNRVEMGITDEEYVSG